VFNPDLAMNLHARYTIVRKIADGGTAEIFLATQHGAQGFEKTVVLKRIFSAFYADPQFRNMLIDEALIAMSLNHSNIVQVLDLGESDGQYVMALELVDGWTLDALLRRTRALATGVPPALALYVTAEVCRALAYAHAKSGSDGRPLAIVHRDISPHNVLVSEQGEVKLTDFGIAKAQNRREKSLGNFIKGKIAFMSPEQASGAVLDARSDLFSLGTMLYVMICRRYPFDAPTDLEVLLLVKSGEFVAPEVARPGMNPEIYRVLRRAMSRDADQRYQRAEDMLHDVEQVMRVAFRAVGQTELKRWLLELSERDGVSALTRVIAHSPPAAAAEGDGRGDSRAVDRAETIAVPAPTEPPEPSGRAAKDTGGGGGTSTSPLAATLAGLRKSSGGMPAPTASAGMRAWATTPPAEDAGLPTMSAVPATPTATGGGPPPPPAKALATGRRATPPPPPAEARVTRSHRPLPRLDTPESEITPAPVEPLPPAAAVAQNLEPASAPIFAFGQSELAVGQAERDVPVAAMVAETTMPVRVPRPRRRRILVLAGAVVVVLGVVLWAERGTRPPARRAAATVASRPAREAEQKPLVVASKPTATGISIAPSASPVGPALAQKPDKSVDAAGATPAAAPVREADDRRALAATDKGKPAEAVEDPDQPQDPGQRGGEEDVPSRERVGSSGRARIVVLLKSEPPGAEVTSSHRNFGSTPVSVRLRPGVRYALTFRADGYRPFVKRIQVGKDSETELTVTLKRGSRQSGPADGPPETPTSAKPTNRNWWQKMFTR
jgi:eukaryotic-like serine/threonine-protein kinase